MNESLFGEFSQVAGSLALASLGLGLLGVISMKFSLTHSLRQKILVASLALILASPVVVLIRPEFGRFFPAGSHVTKPLAETAQVAVPQFDFHGESPITLPDSAVITRPSATEVATVIWLTGSAVLLLWTFLQMARLRRRLKRLPTLTEESRRHLASCWPDDSPLNIDRVVLRLDADVCSPYSFFGIKPQIVFPASWPADFSKKQITAILAHELSHLQHRDSWHALAWRCSAAIHWWNPLVWILFRQNERLMEYRDDEKCTSSPQDRIDFARLLVATAENQLLGSAPSTVQAVGNSNSTILRHRIRRLLNSKPKNKIHGRWSAVLAVALITANATWLIGCASVPSSPRLPRATLVENLRAKQKSQENVGDRLSKYSENLSGVSRSDQLVAVEILIFEFSQRVRGGPQPPRVQLIDKAESARLKAEFSSRRDASLITFPRLLGFQGQVATFRSTVNQPYFAESKTTRDASGNASGTVAVEYVPIGTTISTLPSLLKNHHVHLALDLDISESIGEQISAEGDPYPVIGTERVSGAYEIADGGGIYLEFPRDTAKDGRNSLALIIAVETTDDAKEKSRLK